MPRQKTYTYLLLWFDDPPTEGFDIEATTFKKAARALYREYHRTGWEAVVLESPGRKYAININLDADTFEEAAKFTKAGVPAE